MSTKNLNITFPTRHYVGRVKEPNNDTPLGFMVPHGDDVAFEKRKSSVDQWSCGGGWRSHGREAMEALILDNEPQTGFAFGNTVRHGYGWNTGDTKWRVTDPRGFELEINASNLRQIMSDCTIERDVILEACKWARSGTGNVLVPVHSEEYRNALENTERKAKTANIKDAQRGDYVILQNGSEGTYLGSYFPWDYEYANGHHYTSYSYPDRIWKVGAKKRHFFKKEAHIFEYANPKLSEIQPAPRLSELDALKLLFDHHTVALTKHDDIGFDFVPLSGQQLHGILEDKRCQRLAGRLGGEWVYVEYSLMRNGKLEAYFFDHDALRERSLIMFEKHRDGSYGWPVDRKVELHPQDVNEWYAVVQYVVHAASGERLTRIF